MPSPGDACIAPTALRLPEIYLLKLGLSGDVDRMKITKESLMTSPKKKVWLIAGSRTPIGSFGKSLKSVTVDKLLRHVLRHSVRRAGINPGQVDEVIVGHGFQSGYTPNTARFAWIEEGYPANVPGMTVSRQCGSGMEAVGTALDKLRGGQGELMIAGGCESMSTVPYLIPGKKRWGKWTAWVEKWLKIPR